jgi:hypothetical protein
MAKRGALDARFEDALGETVEPRASEKRLRHHCASAQNAGEEPAVMVEFDEGETGSRLGMPATQPRKTGRKW